MLNSLLRRLRKLYEKPARRDNDESMTAMVVLNRDLIPDFRSASLELDLARKLTPHLHTFAPLHYAVFSDATISELECLLLDEDANAVAYNDMTALHLALCLSANAYQVAKCLIERGADVNRRMRSFQFTPLMIAVYMDLRDVLLLLVESGANANSANDEGLTPLILAAALGNEDMVKILVERASAEPNCRLKSSWLAPLHLASMRVDHEILSDIVRPSSAGGELSNDEDMIIAMEMKKSRIFERERENIVAILLDNGADVHARDASGKTPLHFAVQHENACAKTLLNRGADANASDDAGRLPLHHAIDNRRGCQLECLLKNGADIYDVGKIDRLAFRKTIEGDDELSPISLVLDAHVNGIFEVCRISVERAGIFQELLEHRILQYLVKLEAANLHVSDNSKSLIDEIGFDDYHVECTNEVDRMKLYKVKRNLTLYDLLHARPKHRARVMKKWKLPAILESRFPIYWEIFQANFCTGRRKKKLLTGKKFSWYWITNGEVPDIYVKNAPDGSSRTLNVMSSYWYRGE